jgi:signal transduction histidine kinase
MPLALVAVLALRFFDPSLAAGIRLTQFDVLQRMSPRPAAEPRVAIVEIDDAALAVHGQWPWPRNLLAALVDRTAAAEPAAIGIGILFNEPDRLSPERLAEIMPGLPGDIRERLKLLPTHDEMLAESFRGRSVVLSDVPPLPGSYGSETEEFLRAYPAVLRNLPALEAAGAARGVAIFSADVDGVVRRLPFAVRAEGQDMASFPVELLRVALGASHLELDVEPAFGVVSGRIGEIEVPTDAGGNVWLRYAYDDRANRVSAADLLAGVVESDRLRGKIVVIGTTASGIGSTFVTPLGQQVPGLVLVAQAIEGMVGGTLLIRNGVVVLVELLVLMAVFALFAAFGAYRRVGTNAALLVGCCAALVLASWAAYELFGILFDASIGIVAAGAFFVVRLSLDLYREARNRLTAEKALRQALAHAEAGNRAKSDFLANMSHELRTPLTAILGFSSIIRDQSFGPVGNAKYAEYAGDIHGSGSHLLAIISDILEMSKIETGHATVQDAMVDVGRVAAEVVAMLRPRSERKQLAVALETAATQGRGLRADARMVKQMLLNLVTNAVTFTDDKGRVTLKSRMRSDGGIDIEVADTGIGIAPAEQAKVLEPFYTAEQPHARSYQGTGLGLPITKSMVELHGGRLSLTSKLGTGTAVALSFPPDRTIRLDDELAPEEAPGRAPAAANER